ncbi:hypothetical protein AB0F72_29620 [Actinoplanes sp. NPDC023936]|uniref:hypothetical protein n=1 Tax=Actinoplanes sp. NPDC023936 TaxID=3154910 RepID=UPI0033F2F6BF
MTVRGGLDDALDKLARRDELRRRASGETPSTPPAVTELVEAIAGVISRHPELAVTVGVEGAGDPVLLHFGFADGVVQVSADNTVAARAAEAPPKHADFEIVVDAEPVYEAEPAYEAPQPYAAPQPYDPPQAYEPAQPYEPPRAYEPEPAYQAPAEPPRASRDDQDRFGPTDFDYQEPPTAERPFVSPAAPFADQYAEPVPHPFAATPPPPVPPQTPFQYGSSHGYGEPPYSGPPFQPESSYAPTRPAPEPAQSSPQAAFISPQPQPDSAFAAPQPQPESAFAAPQPQSAHSQPPAQPHVAPQQPAQPEPAAQPGFPPPLAKPIPLQVERPEETEQAARRLAALLRDDPTLLDAPHD